MTTTRSLIAGAVAALVAGSAFAGQATVFSNRDFRGQSLTLDAPHPDINASIRDVDSIIVHSGRWEFCARPGFQGRCESLGPGRYYSLREDRLVFLCWRYGEERITHWHEIDGGFAGRQPVDDLMLSQAP